MMYLRMCLAHSAGATAVSQNMVDMQDDAPAIGRYILSLISAEPAPKGDEANPVQVYMDLLQQLLTAVGGERRRGRGSERRRVAIATSRHLLG